MAEDVKEMQRKLKEMELRSKMESKLEKKKLKDEKLKMKLQKRHQKMEKKLAKKGKAAPDEFKMMDTGTRSGDDALTGTGTGTGDKIVKAEVVEFTPKEWERRSVQSMSEIENKIDRFSGKGVAGLSERYREKYGEDLKVPELYQIETSLELDSPLEELARDDDESDPFDKRAESPTEKRSGGFFNSRKKESTIEVGEPGDKPAPKFFDLTTGLFFLTKKFGSKGGGGKKAVMLIIDILLLPTILIRIFTTLIFVQKRKKARKSSKITQESAQFADA